MGLMNDNSDFWYRADDGSWQPVSQISELSISINLTEEDVAKLASMLVPLGELEIVPRGEE